MRRRRLLGGLRTRLALAFAGIVVALLAGSFFAIHQGIGADLQQRIESDLAEDYSEFQGYGPAQTANPERLDRAAKGFITAQGYHAASRIFVIDVPGRREVTNQREVVESELNEPGEGAGDDEPSLLDAPFGYSTVATPQTGELRLLSRPIVHDGRQVGVFRVAEPLGPVEEAQAGLRSTFALVGAVGLVMAVAVAVWAATLITRPLRRAAGVASVVGAGDLHRRIEPVEGADEARILAEAFNGMLDRLEGSFQRQRDFVADASHELRTPLTVLRGEIELMADEEGPADPERTQRLLSELDQMNRLIDDMLVLARTESGGLVRPRVVDAEGFFADLARDLPLFGPRDYRVEAALDRPLRADPGRLNQVFRNLVRNAVAHTTEGQRVTVGARDLGAEVEFWVSDEGPGVPTDQLELVFNRFHRTDAARSREDGGSGLGLTIARAIVEAHGGWIRAESEPGSGTTVRFRLPQERSAAGAESAQVGSKGP